MTSPLPEGLSEGLSASLSHQVTEADTAEAVGSGDVPVLGTPRVLALLEAATVQALSGRLARDETTVGTRVVLSHQAATPIGRRVVATATLSAVERRLLTFHVRLLDGDRIAAEGEIARVIVNRQQFLDRAATG